MLASIEDLVRHVARTNDRAWHDTGDFLARTCKTENVADQDADAFLRLLDRAGAFRGLRVIDDDKARANAPTVLTFELHAADASGDAGNANHDSACPAPLDRRQHNFVTGPRDACALAVVQLTGASVRDAVELMDGICDLRKIFRQLGIAFDGCFDGIENFQSGDFRRANQCDELTMTVKHRPNTCRF